MPARVRAGIRLDSRGRIRLGKGRGRIHSRVRAGVGPCILNMIFNKDRGYS